MPSERSRDVLQGRRILITRPAARAAQLLERLETAGARAEAHSPIAFEQPAEPGAAAAAIDALSHYDWLLFTSATGVRFFAAAVGSREIPAELCVAAVGEATAAAARQAGWGALLEADGPGAAGLAEAVARRSKPGERALWVRPEVAAGDLSGALSAVGVTVDAVAFYRTVPSPAAASIAGRIARAEWDAVLWTSPSAVRVLLETDPAARPALARVASFAIGATTENALTDAGLPPHGVAEHPDPESLFALIRDYFDGR